MSDFARIERLVLTNFRNHARLEIESGSPAIVLYGPNGAGKTNILEAISILGSSRGLRSADLDSLIQHDADAPWAVSAQLSVGDESHRIGVGLSKNQKTAGDGLEREVSRRIARLDGKNVSASALDDILQVIWMTPAHDRLFAGSGGEKRRFLDHLIAASVPEHRQVVNQYEKAMRERNRLLEQQMLDHRWLSVVESQMASFGVALMMGRMDGLSALQAAIDSRPAGAFPAASLFLTGDMEALGQEGLNAAELEAWFSGKLFENRKLDAHVGRALIGPHRSNFSAIHRGNNSDGALCSTGEQKALVIGLVLAQAQRIGQGLTRNEIGAGPSPIVLLDEAGAHLDKARRIGLCEALLELPTQSWVTGTDGDLFEGFGAPARFFEIGPSQAMAATLA